MTLTISDIGTIAGIVSIVATLLGFVIRLLISQSESVIGGRILVLEGATNELKAFMLRSAETERITTSRLAMVETKCAETNANINQLESSGNAMSYRFSHVMDEARVEIIRNAERMVAIDRRVERLERKEEEQKERGS